MSSTQNGSPSPRPPSMDSPPHTPPGVTPPPTGTHSAPAALRKQLPAIPDTATQLSLAARMAAKGTPRNNHSYGPCFLEYSLMAEYQQLQKQKLPGVYVIPSARSTLLWNGVLFIRQGIYQEGIFRFSLYIPENYPDGDCVRIVFDPPVFHPLIDPVSGELDVKRGFPRWRRNVNHIWQVLLYARRVFYKIDSKNPQNPEASVLYEQDMEVYKHKVVENIKLCKSRLYEPPASDDPHAIMFTEWDETVHSDARRQMLQPKEVSPNDLVKNAQTSGLSWMKKGSTQVFSQPTAEDSTSL